MGLISKIFEISPYIEVIARRIYWNSAWLIDLAGRRVEPPQVQNNASPHTLDKIQEFLRAQGVTAGSLLIVHSSGRALKPTGCSPAQIVDRLIETVGSSGTLALPAFPKYEGEPQGIERIRASVADLELVYDVAKSIPWTGVLPLKLMQRPGAIRSRHPLNTMVALGPLASPMMESNLAGDRPLPCGPQSSWKFCADRGAIVVALGVDMAHSLTMIHVAEDSYENDWPVKDWYRERKFKVVDGQSTASVVVRERHPRWAMHYAERTLSADLKRNGILASTQIDGIQVEVLAAQRLLRFLNERKATAYPYYMIPRRSKKP